MGDGSYHDSKALLRPGHPVIVKFAIKVVERCPDELDLSVMCFERD